jgi:hypothetical protein
LNPFPSREPVECKVKKNWVVAYLNHDDDMKFDWRGFRILNDKVIDAILDLKPDIMASQNASVEEAIYRYCREWPKALENPEVQQWIKDANAASKPLPMVATMTKTQQYRLNQAAAQLRHVGNFANQRGGGIRLDGQHSNRV